MGHKDSHLGSKRLILAGDIRLRSWPNIGDSYGISALFKEIHRYTWLSNWLGLTPYIEQVYSVVKQMKQKDA
jgi:hypothetical protein